MWHTQAEGVRSKAFEDAATKRTELQGRHKALLLESIESLERAVSGRASGRFACV